MGTLDKRLEALESKLGSNLPTLVIIRRIVRPDGQLDPANVAEIDGNRFTRCDDESEEDFIDRVVTAGRDVRKPGQNFGVRVLSGSDICG